MSSKHLLVLAALLATIAVGSGLAPVTAAPPAPPSDEVTAEEDNPEGCVTATGAEQVQCGAQGRDHFASAQHRPPIEACADSVDAATGSRITRIKPDGPRHEDGTLAFVPGACVYLPPGYDSGDLRYPVVYLFHGGGGDQADWVTFGNVRGVLDGIYAQDPADAVIAIMPDGRNGQWYDTPNPNWLVQTYLRDHLVPYVDRHFRTLGDRFGRAVTGLSNGGYGALHLAGRAPDLFVAAGSMSGNLGAYDFRELYTEMAPGVNGAATHFQGSLPINLIPNMDHLDLTIVWGATCAVSDVTTDACATWGFEQLFRPENQAFRDRLVSDGYQGEYEYFELDGSHAWRWWTPWLRDLHMPFFLDRLDDPEPVTAPKVAPPIPDSFRYRSTFEAFDVWGYHVEIDRPAREFLELRDVTQNGLTVIGSGQPEITTAPRYTPGRRYRISGAGALDTVVRADKQGRLTFPVDLGPAHPQEQYYTVEGTVGTTMGDYFTERTVTITSA